MNPLMRIQIEPHADLKTAPRSLYRGERRIDIIEILDQWYGPGYRYVKGVICRSRQICRCRVGDGTARLVDEGKAVGVP
jgi:hypothetical protein